MSDVAWIALLAAVSVAIVAVSVGIVPSSFTLEEVLRRVDQIFTPRANEGRIVTILRVACQLLALLWVLKRPTAGRVDLGSVGILAFQVFFGWDKVALKVLELLPK